MGPTWVLSAPDGPNVGPVNLAIWDVRVVDTQKTLASQNQITQKSLGPGWLRNFHTKSVLVNKNFPTCHLIHW